ncbi:8-oxo-dGTP pyrophosphatase MutT (NUDIX family) [Neorhizobium sp. 2083]|uniref:NUDIX hydrolase n=1 Tax=Neorhizobium sp. 2083 TaxID=2817762 RepID=UPI0028612815|nr:NUDIX hydrolase [Neorhizobium sp. 2083]MDR6820874.1 8-oxo-dGTP pyrophosphatase MutT (NUDIX family) [Neorhizobium sp. 2083]
MKDKHAARPKKPTKSQRLLQRLAATPDQLFNGKFRQQFDALCIRRQPATDAIEILVITSRDSGRWVIPKGWPMKGRKPHAAAAIEAWEEAGVRGDVRKKPVGRYTYLKELDNGDVAPCIVDVFEIAVTEIRENFKEHGQRQRHWVSPDEAARRVREVELKSILVAFKPHDKNRR